MTELKETLRDFHKDLNILQERQAKYAGNAPLELIHQIEDYQTAISLTEQTLAGQLSQAEWHEALRPLLLAIDKRAAASELCQVTIGDIGGDVRDAIIAGRDVHLVIYNYPPPPSPTVRPVDIPATAEEPIPECPYRGLFAFRPEHAHLFFGREKFTHKLIQAATSRQLVVVLGASGSGKSSVVFAGLVPALLKRLSEPWLFTTFRPGDDPFLGLANALVPLLEPELSKVKQIGEARDLATRLRAGHSPLNDYLNSIHQAYPDHRLLLIADQFEELYTLCRDTELRHRFLDTLIRAFTSLSESDAPLLSRSSAPLHLVLTLRADFLGQASLYRPFADALQGTTELLGPMTRAEMTQAVEKPADLQDVRFETNLVDRLLEDVGHEEGSLPLLEFALTELWQQQRQGVMTHTAYEEIGQVSGALSRHADRAYRRLSAAEQEQARRIFARLVNPGAGTEDTRRLATRTELDQNWPLVAKLANERLLVTNQAEDAQDTVEVVHEALIRHWQQLRQWLEADREFLTWQLGLQADLKRWAEAGRDEGALLRGAPLAVAQDKLRQRPDDLTGPERAYIEASLAAQERQDRRRRWLLAGAVAAAVVMAVLAVFSIFQWQDANQQRAALAEQNEKAQAELNFYQATDPAERLAELSNLFSRADADSRARARHLFFSLPEVDQLALLRVADRPEKLAVVGRALLPNLADINGIYYTDDYLNALLESVADADLRATLEGWLAARQAAQNEDYETALAQYDDLLQTNDQNPALWLERARIGAKLGQNGEALAGLSKVMELAQAAEYRRSGVLPAGPEFAHSQQMAKAVQRLIMVQPDLAAAYEASAAEYPILPEVTMPKVELDEMGVPMVQVPAGRFKMGSNQGSSDEQPVHEVYLAEFYIDRYEVTNEQFVAFLNEQGNQVEGEITWYNPDAGRIEEQGETWQVRSGFDKHPVTGVSWYGAKSFCAWRGGRLPTEAEWEKAARGSDERSYPWGEKIADHLARYDNPDRKETTAPVGHYPEGVSPYGAYDIAGNVWEWVVDAYVSNYYQNSPARNPTGPKMNRICVLRCCAAVPGSTSTS